MATMLDRAREGLIWGYAALTLVEERQTKRRQWWEQERLRLKEEARGHLDAALREMEERRAQRRDWVRQRIRERLGTGIVTADDLSALEAKIDELVAKVDHLHEQGMGHAAAAATSSAHASTQEDTPPTPDMPSAL